MSGGGKFRPHGIVAGLSKEEQKMKTLIQEIKVAKQKTGNRRREWNEKSRDTIFNALNKAVNELGVSEIGGTVIKVKKYENLEEIALLLGNEASGILEKKPPGGSRIFVKNNGFINFKQLISGHIEVVCQSVYVEEIGNNPVQYIKETVDPSAVTEAWVLDHLRNFLIEFKEYEESWI
jgi:hypothetical protein